ncbi:MAG TPA: iron-containing alcohol dehydrogenase [Candidatus Paceibacterota bacterium]|nr:iron-containing alcohol dehydrogenase [Verrucomicrobiota bacterium]HRY48530.1 iron-containing alcohol dehydrogenase [Candidatus Paceibacterota bacterium]HRZ99277.1 iron-containing alcohol dehydrogenase [Candidatus Paceibacterota bacterium]
MISNLLELRKFVAPEFVYGLQARHLAGRYVRNWGAHRVMVVTDPGVIAAGWTEEMVRSLEQEGIHFVVFKEISPNPRDHEVMEGVRCYQREGCDALLAIGGGSVIDCAKGIGIVVANGGNVLDFEGVDQVPMPMPPLICIPTTGGTSADVSQFAIINHTAEKVKIAIISKAVVPDAALVDPQTLVTLSPYLTACTGMDALVHAVEAFVSNAASPLTDMHALQAVKLIHEHLALSIADPGDLEHRGGVMLASLEAGLAFSNASLGCVHALAHSLGGYLDLPHGECNALLLPQVVEFNFSSAPERFHQIGDSLGLNLKGLSSDACCQALVRHLTEMRQQLGIPGTLKDRGLAPTDIPILATKALRDPCNATNPRTPTGRDLEIILEASL